MNNNHGADRRIKARPTTYKNIDMRSRLEAGFAAWLDKFHVKWQYEPRAYANENGQYLPDFELSGVPFMGQLAKLFIEVKPTTPDFDALRAQYAILQTSVPDAVMVAVHPAVQGEVKTFLSLEIGGYGGGHKATWTYRRDGTVALDIAVPPLHSPWNGEYWKPGAR